MKKPHLEHVHFIRSLLPLSLAGKEEMLVLAHTYKLQKFPNIPLKNGKEIALC